MNTNIISELSSGRSSIFSFVWLLFALIVLYEFNPISYWEHNILTLCGVCSYVIAIYNWVHSGNRIFSLYMAFVVYAMFSNLGQSIVYAITHEEQFMVVYTKYTMPQVCYMLKYQFTCAAALNLGTCLYMRKSYRNVSAKQVNEYYREKVADTNVPALWDSLLYICLIVVLYFTLYQLALRRSMSYSDLYNSRETISAYFAFGTIVLGIRSIFQKRHVNIVLGFWIWYILAYFAAGTRSMAIIYVGALVFCFPIAYPQYFKRRYYLIWFLTLLAGITSISIISTFRTEGLDSSAVVSDGYSIAFVDSIMEMGISQLTTCITIEQIQSGFEHCQTILYNILLGFLPGGLLDDVVPESWLLRPGTWVNEVSNTTTTEWGYSWIAESYLNYGEFGWIFTGVYGYFIAFAENYSLRRLMKGQYLMAICLIAILCKQIFFARAQINLVMSFYKPSIYILYFWLLFGKRNKLSIRI